MYVTATSPRSSLGRSTPATRAMSRLRLRLSPFERRLCRRNPPGGGFGGGRRGPLRRLSLSGLVPRVLADDARHAPPLDDLAVLAPHLHRRPHLHRLDVLSLPCSSAGFARAIPLGGGIGRGAKPPSELFEPVRDAPAGQVVGRELHLHAVARQDPDEVHPHLAAHVREHFVAVLQLHPEHRVRQRLHHSPLDLDRIFFGHFRVSTSGSPSVTATVCSKCAARLPSLVTAVQPSSRIRTSQLPIVTIGSIASTIPGPSCGPRPGSPKFGICGSSCSARPMPCPTKARTTDRPWASTWACTACETSESRRPGQHSLIARSRLSRVTSSSFRTPGSTGPTGWVNAQSA